MSTYYAKTASIVNTSNDRAVEAEVDNIKIHESLNAFIAHNKIHMRWNGKTYVGNMAGMEFTTQGPEEFNTGIKHGQS
jgi:hypothetical protein